MSILVSLFNCRRQKIKKEFRKCQEKTGVVEQLTKVLIGLYEEPEKAIE